MEQPRKRTPQHTISYELTVEQKRAMDELREWSKPAPKRAKWQITYSLLGIKQ